jgi:hypothetical protein
MRIFTELRPSSERHKRPIVTVSRIGDGSKRGRRSSLDVRPSRADAIRDLRSPLRSHYPISLQSPEDQPIQWSDFNGDRRENAPLPPRRYLYPQGLICRRKKCHRLSKVEMTSGRASGLTWPQLLPEPRAMVVPLSAYLVPPGCLAAAHHCACCSLRQIQPAMHWL